MEQLIFITNGTGGCGKDTFADFMSERVRIMKVSSIDKVKEIARDCGWHGGKTERDRKFLSDLKLLTTEYSDLAFNDISKSVHRFRKSMTRDVLLIDIREPAEIERAKKTFGAKTILIVREGLDPISSNMADANVNNYDYDYVVYNDGTLEDFKQTVYDFVDNYILEKESK